MLAVIDPVCPVVRSLIEIASPSGVSRMSTNNQSPEFINRSLLGSGLYVASVALTGLAAACDCPFLVMNAKLTYSLPTCSRQALLSTWPVFIFSDRLSILSAAHHLSGSHESAKKGGRTQPGG